MSDSITRGCRTQDDLESRLERIDGKGYKAYRDIVGRYRFSDYVFCIDHVQADPFAPPSRVRVAV
ncbi:MAG: ABC-ATPase domain-containing protein, partial [Methanoregulaceae archaeon]